MILDYVKNVGITLSGMLISMFLVTLLNYFNIIGAYFLSVLEINKENCSKFFLIISLLAALSDSSFVIHHLYYLLWSIYHLWNNVWSNLRQYIYCNCSQFFSTSLCFSPDFFTPNSFQKLMSIIRYTADKAYI